MRNQLLQQLLQQFKNIKTSLTNNVDTIGLLIKQAESLSAIAEKLSGAKPVEKILKKQLEKEVKNIRETIAKLIKETNNLFDLYYKFGDALFKSKG